MKAPAADEHASDIGLCHALSKLAVANHVWAKNKLAKWPLETASVCGIRTKKKGETAYETIQGNL